MPKKSSRRRLSDSELEFLENIRAGACGIIQDVKALSYWIDDPDQLEISLDILIKAKQIRKVTLKREEELKQAACDERSREEHNDH